MVTRTIDPRCRPGGACSRSYRQKEMRQCARGSEKFISYYVAAIHSYLSRRFFRWGDRASIIGRLHLLAGSLEREPSCESGEHSLYETRSSLSRKNPVWRSWRMKRRVRGHGSLIELALRAAFPLSMVVPILLCSFNHFLDIIPANIFSKVDTLCARSFPKLLLQAKPTDIHALIARELD